MTLIQLTKKLISIPSYVRGNTNEKQIGEFVFNYLKQFPFLEVRKQKVWKGRFNVIAETRGRPRLLLAGHMDTVEPKQGWVKDQFMGTIERSKLFGLGSLDMKGGIAAILDSLNDFTDIEGLTLLFYCDEEYDFRGMRRFIKDYNTGTWDLAVIAEQSDLKIWNEHRGLIEIYCSVKGKTGHAADPQSCRNAIMGLIKTLQDIQRRLQKYKNPVLGTPSMNIAFIRGGLDLGKKYKEETLLGKQGNNIADFAEAVIDIRPTTVGLRAKKIMDWLKSSLKKSGLTLLEYSVRHDLSSLSTPPNKFRTLERVVARMIGRADYLNPINKGYGDGQLLQQKFGIPVVYFGPKGANSHAADEFVNVPSLKKLRKVFSNLIKEYCQ